MFSRAEEAASEMRKKGAMPAVDVYEGRPDLPVKEKMPI